MNHTEQGTIAVGAPGSAMRRITEHPEPQTEPVTDYHVKTNTPWGTAQSARHYAKGLIMYSTASHGGFKVSGKLLERIPEYLRTADKYASGEAGWFEEDCASAIVIVCLPEFFSMEWRESAISTMQHFYTKQWEQFCQAQ